MNPCGSKMPWGFYAACQQEVYYALCQNHYVALAAAAQPAKHNVLCFAIEGSISACGTDSVIHFVIISRNHTLRRKLFA